MIKSTGNKVVLGLFCLCSILFLLLSSYQTILGLIDLTPNQKQTIDYLEKQQELDLNYTASELSHLEDVKKVMGLKDYLFYISGIMMIAIIFYHRKDKLFLKRLFWSGGLTTSIISVIILLSGLISFNSSFTVFHQIFFPQGNWQFPADSLLIQTFPIEVFIKISFFIFILTLAEGIVFILLAPYLKKNEIIRI